MRDDSSLALTGPIAASDRIHRLDVLRGFAVTGVYLVSLFEADTITPGGDEFSIGHMVNFFVEGSFYPLFSLLFGIGFALQMDRFKRAARPFHFLYIRRSVALIAIGVAAFVFILGNPILIRYGSLALLLLLFGKAGTRTILIASVVTLLIVLGQGPALKLWADGQRGNPGPALELWADGQRGNLVTATALAERAAARRTEGALVQARAQEAMKAGRYGDIVTVRWHAVQRLMSNPWFYAGSRNLSIFMMFLLGLFTARVGLITRPTVDRRQFLNIAIAGFALGIAGNALLLFLPTLLRRESPFVRGWTRDVIYYIANPALGLAYGAMLMRVSETSAAWKWLQLLAPVGRMALTNFLLQFVLMPVLLWSDRGSEFRSPLWGFGFAAQVLLSHWWLSRYRHGPVEWLWRVLTFGRLRHAGAVKAVEIPA